MYKVFRALPRGIARRPPSTRSTGRARAGGGSGQTSLIIATRWHRRCAQRYLPGSHCRARRARGGDGTASWRRPSLRGVQVVIQLEKTAPTGTSTAAALRRLRKHRPDLHAAVLAGRMTAHAAMVAAGFRPKTITVAPRGRAPGGDAAAAGRATGENVSDGNVFSRTARDPAPRRPRHHQEPVPAPATGGGRQTTPCRSGRGLGTGRLSRTRASAATLSRRMGPDGRRKVVHHSICRRAAPARSASPPASPVIGRTFSRACRRERSRAWRRRRRPQPHGRGMRGAQGRFRPPVRRLRRGRGGAPWGYGYGRGGRDPPASPGTPPP